jgi:aminoglycoside phosphotransferase family enzyme
MLPSHLVADQSRVFAFLARGENYGCAEPVRRVDTHGAAVFLAGKDVYKVKRAVRFPLMDFSSLEKRRAACEAEVTVNAPNAAGLYLGTVPITRSQAGFELGGDGEAVEWAVHMRRFDESRTLDRVAKMSGLSPKVLAELARAILAAHAQAPRRGGAAAVALLERTIAENRSAFLESPELFPAERVAQLATDSARALDDVRTLLLDRGAAGYVRRCHGDLHLRNIVLLEAGPTLFDAIEFDDAIATGDVLYDLAFLLMDLWQRGLEPEASRIFNRYLSLGKRRGGPLRPCRIAVVPERAGRDPGESRRGQSREP